MLRPDFTNFARGGFVAACILACLAPQVGHTDEDILRLGKRLANQVASGQVKASDLTTAEHHAMRTYALSLRGVVPKPAPTTPAGVTAENLAAHCVIATPERRRSGLTCSDPALARVERNCVSTRNDDGSRTLACGSPELNIVVSTCFVASDAHDHLTCPK